MSFMVTLTVEPPPMAVRMDSRSDRPIETVLTRVWSAPDMPRGASSRLPMMSAAAPSAVATSAFSSKEHRPRLTRTTLPVTSWS